jgi:polyisoprenoid-binding protein YceI
MKHASILSLCAAALFFAGCSENPAKNKPQAEVAPPSGTAATTPGTGATATPPTTTAEAPKTDPAVPGRVETLAISPTTSKIGFTASKVTASHEGGFNTFDGTISLSPEGPQKSSFAVKIKTDSIHTDAEKLTGHLKTADFFDVAKYPEATFTSTGITPKSGSEYTVTGDLDLHGVKKSITFPANITVAKDRVTATSEFAINRRDFQINYAGMANDLIRDEVLLKLKLDAPRAPATN